MRVSGLVALGGTLAGALVLTAAAAHAQYNGGAAQGAVRQGRMETEMAMSALERSTEAYRDSQNPRRVRRADQAAALINAGDCPGALTLARRENDGRLAARIQQICDSEATARVSAPRSVPATPGA